MRLRPAVVLIEKNKIMLLRYSYSGKDVYQFPGGNVEHLETLEETLVRELEEELNLPIEVKRLILSAQVVDLSKVRSTMHCLFEGSILSEAKPIINNEHTSAQEVVWIDIERLDQLNLYPSVGEKLKSILSASSSSETHYLGLINQPWF